MEPGAMGSMAGIKQNLPYRVEALVRGETNPDFNATENDPKLLFQKKLQSVTTTCKSLCPVSITAFLLFTIICLAQIGRFNFVFKWQQAALFVFMTFSLTLNTYS